jgi:hypothetical protein
MSEEMEVGGGEKGELRNIRRREMEVEEREGGG